MTGKIKRVLFQVAGLVAAGILSMPALAQIADPESTLEAVEPDIVVTSSRVMRLGTSTVSIAAFELWQLFDIGLTEEDEPVAYTDQVEYFDAVSTVLPFYVGERPDSDRYCHTRAETRPAVRAALKRCGFRPKSRQRHIGFIVMSRAGDKISIGQNAGDPLSISSYHRLYQRSESGTWFFVDDYAQTVWE